MNKITMLLMTIITALSFSLGATMQSKAQDKNYSGIVPFVTGNDRIGFFDQSNARVYLYDSALSQCLFVGQIQSLGEPITVITSKAVSTPSE